MKNKYIKKMHIKIFIISAVVFMALILLLLAGWKRKETPLLEIDGMIVSEEEVQMFANDARASAAAHFYQECGLDSGQPGFWSTETDGQTPAQYLLEEILPQITRAKIIQAEMVRYGIIESADYSAFLQTYSETMDQRKKDASSGKVIYGPVELPLKEFYSYYFGQCETELRNCFKSESRQYSEEELRDYYEELKNTDLKPEVTGTIAFYENLSDARANLSPEETFILSSSYAGKEDENQQNFIHWMETSEEGSITGPAEYDGRSGYFVLICREQQPFPEFEEVKDNLSWMYGDAVYETELTEKSSRAQINMDHSAILGLIEKFCSSGE